MNALEAVNEAAARAIYHGEAYVAVFVRGRVLVCIDRPDVIPYGSVILERCWP